MDKIIKVLEQRLNSNYFHFNNLECFILSSETYKKLSDYGKKFHMEMRNKVYNELEYIKALILEFGFSFEWDSNSMQYKVVIKANN